MIADEESSTDQGEGHCACQFPQDDVMLRLKKYVKDLTRIDAGREETARMKAKQAG